MKYEKIGEIIRKLNKVNKSLRVSLKSDLIEIREYTFMKKPAKFLLILVLHLMIFVMLLNVLENWVYFALFIIIQALILIRQLVSAYNFRKMIIIHLNRPELKLIENDKIITLNSLSEIIGISAHIIEHRLVSNWGTLYSQDFEYKLKFELNDGATFTIGDMSNNECDYFVKWFRFLLIEVDHFK